MLKHLPCINLFCFHNNCEKVSIILPTLHAMTKTQEGKQPVQRSFLPMAIHLVGWRIRIWTQAICFQKSMYSITILYYIILWNGLFLWNEISSVIPVNKSCHSHEGFQPSKCRWNNTSHPAAISHFLPGKCWGAGVGRMWESAGGSHLPHPPPLIVTEEWRMRTIKK